MEEVTDPFLLTPVISNREFENFPVKPKESSVSSSSDDSVTEKKESTAEGGK